MIKFIKISIIANLLTLLFACQSSHNIGISPNKIDQAKLMLDSSFNGYQNVVVESELEIFGLNQEMIEMARVISLESDSRKKAEKLLRSFFQSEKASLAYKSDANVIAAQAFKDKQANCLSLTIMAYTIAKEAQLNVAFQSVRVPEYWIRNGSVNMLTGHVNLAVLPENSNYHTLSLERTNIEIDFDPFVNKKSFPKQKIDKDNVLAMFYNNKGANAMVEGDYLTAYAYFKQAVSFDPMFSAAWGNLGILYRVNGYEKSAIDVYRYAIDLDLNNLTAMENLSMLLHKNGQYNEARLLDRHIIYKRVNNPYYYALLGDEKFYSGHYNAAINHFQKAITLNSNIHEFYFGLAKAYYMLDEIDKAETYIRKAMKKSRSSRIDQQYVAKLNVLKQLEQDNL